MSLVAYDELKVGGGVDIHLKGGVGDGWGGGMASRASPCAAIATPPSPFERNVGKAPLRPCFPSQRQLSLPKDGLRIFRRRVGAGRRLPLRYFAEKASGERRASQISPVGPKG